MQVWVRELGRVELEESPKKLGDLSVRTLFGWKRFLFKNEFPQFPVQLLHKLPQPGFNRVSNFKKIRPFEVALMRLLVSETRASHLKIKPGRIFKKKDHNITHPTLVTLLQSDQPVQSSTG